MRDVDMDCDEREGEARVEGMWAERMDVLQQTTPVLQSALP